MQCGRADHDSCEIIDELNLEIDNLKITVKDLVDEKLELQQKIDDLESDIDDINLGGSL